MTSPDHLTAADLMRRDGIGWNAANATLEDLERQHLLASTLEHGRRVWSPGISSPERLAQLQPRPQHHQQAAPRPQQPRHQHQEPTSEANTSRPHLTPPSSVTRSMLKHHITHNHPGSVLDCEDCQRLRRTRPA